MVAWQDMMQMSPKEVLRELRKKSIWRSKVVALLVWLLALILLFVVVGLILYATAGKHSIKFEGRRICHSHF